MQPGFHRRGSPEDMCLGGEKRSHPSKLAQSLSPSSFHLSIIVRFWEMRIPAANKPDSFTFPEMA
jgi:hypothetical protein